MIRIPELLVEKLRAATHVTVLTGAGVSAESGVPTFRGEHGLWKSHRPEDLATPLAFRRDPVLVQDWYRHRRALVQACAPNPGHQALARLETLVPHFTLVTQNVDSLHEQAGSAHVLHLHGSIAQSYCADCGKDADLDAGTSLPVFCLACGGLVRPGVVWFGENLPHDTLEQAENAAAQADVLLSIGTSGVVYPAAALPLIAREHGAFVAEINPERSAIAHQLHLWIGAPAGEALPALVTHLEADHA